MSLEQTPAIDIWSVGVIYLSLLSARYPVFPGPPRGAGKVNSDAHALAQLEAMLGRPTLQRAAHACNKQILESPSDKILREPPPPLRVLCEQGRKTYFDGVLSGGTSSSGSGSSSRTAGEGSRASAGSGAAAGPEKGESMTKTTGVSSGTLKAEGDANEVELVARVSFPQEAYDLLERCLEVDPSKRISAKEALCHPFLQATFGATAAASARKKSRSANSTTAP